MKTIERIIYILLIIGLVFFLAQKPNKSIEYKTIKGDSIPYEKIVTHDSLIYTDTGSYNVDSIWLHDTVFRPVDTAKILADYFKMIEYDSINLRNDSSITNWVDVKITQNRLYSIKGYSLNNRQQTIVLQDEEGDRFSIGGMVGKDLLAPTISYQYKKHNIGVGYNAVGNNGVILKYEYKLGK